MFVVEHDKPSDVARLRAARETMRRGCEHMAPLGVRIIGCGHFRHLHAEHEPLSGAGLLACADLREDAASAAAAAKLAYRRAASSPAGQRDIDIVVNLTVPAAHFAVSAAALAADKHVFSEKPLCAESEQGRMLVTQAARRGLKLGCAPDTFLGAGGRLAREIIDSGRIGKVLSGTCFLMSHGMEHWHPDPEFYFKPGGGPIFDMAPYYLAALINLIRPVARCRR